MSSAFAHGSKWPPGSTADDGDGDCCGRAASEVSSFCSETSIHGPAYLVGGSSLKRVVWSVAVTVSFVFAVVLIAEAWEEWRKHPVVVTFGDEGIPVTDFQVVM